jgi:excisionase family DNA binding protein
MPTPNSQATASDIGATTLFLDPAQATPSAGDANPKANARVEPLLWSIDDLAYALNLSTRTIKRMARAGELPGVLKIGRRRLFDRRRLEKWIDEGCPPPKRIGRR